MNYKGLLQEYCQKKQIPLPKYFTKKFFKNKDIFEKYSCVNVNNKLYQKKINTSETKNNKKKEEQIIAEYAYNSIKLIDENNKIKFNIETDCSGKTKTSLFIDIENKQRIIEEIEQKIDVNYKNFIDNIDIYVVMSSNHHLFEKMKVGDFYNLEWTYSSYKDAADIYMSYLCGQKLSLYENIGIITSDHFGNSLVDILNEESCTNCKLLKNIDEIIKFLNNMSCYN